MYKNCTLITLSFYAHNYSVYCTTKFCNLHAFSIFYAINYSVPLICLTDLLQQHPVQVITHTYVCTSEQKLFSIHYWYILFLLHSYRQLKTQYPIDFLNNLLIMAFFYLNPFNSFKYLRMCSYINMYTHIFI